MTILAIHFEFPPSFPLPLGIEYKAFKVTPLTTCRQLIFEALEKCNVVQDANLFAIYEVCDSGGLWIPMVTNVVSSGRGDSDTSACVAWQR